MIGKHKGCGGNCYYCGKVLGWKCVRCNKYIPKEEVEQK